MVREVVEGVPKKRSRDFWPATITHNLPRFSEMIPWLKGICTMMNWFSKRVMLTVFMATLR